jgi:hypothetical protein
VRLKNIHSNEFRSIPVALSIVTAIAVTSAPVVYAEIANAQCEPHQNQSFEKLVKTIKELDPVLELKKRAPDKKDDIQTLFGTWISGDCSQVSKQIWNELLARTFAQIDRCYKAIGLKHIRDTTTVLRRARIECSSSSDENVSGFNNLYKNGKWLAKDSIYDISLAQLGIKLPNLKERNPFVMENAAALLFHEALHSTASNQREWHNDQNEIKRRKHSVDCNDSMFTDRIYFLVGVCFPSSEKGELLYGSALGCPNVCKAALKDGAESKVVKEYPADPPLRAESISSVAVDHYCSRVAKIKSKVDELPKSLKFVRFELAKPLALFPKDNSLLRDRYAAITKRLINNITADVDLGRILEEVIIEKVKFRSELEASCKLNKNKNEEWARFCANDIPKVIGAIDRALASFSIDTDLRSIDALVLSPAGLSPDE